MAIYILTGKAKNRGIFTGSRKNVFTILTGILTGCTRLVYGHTYGLIGKKPYIVTAYPLFKGVKP